MGKQHGSLLKAGKVKSMVDAQKKEQTGGQSNKQPEKPKVATVPVKKS
jgi:hypothetical protein